MTHRPSPPLLVIVDCLFIYFEQKGFVSYLTLLVAVLLSLILMDHRSTCLLFSVIDSSCVCNVQEVSS